MQENILSIIRAILVALGSFVIGHKYFAGTIDADIWQSFIGGALVVASTIWGIATKATSIESIQSGLRSLLTFAGAFLLAKGVVTSEQITQVIAGVATIVPLVYSYFSKVKTQQLATGQIKVMQLSGAKDKAA